jgi:ribosomal protein L28
MRGYIKFSIETIKGDSLTLAITRRKYLPNINWKWIQITPRGYHPSMQEKKKFIKKEKEKKREKTSKCIKSINP